MKRRILSLLAVVVLVTSMLATTASAANARAVSGLLTLRVTGTTAYCTGKYSAPIAFLFA